MHSAWYFFLLQTHTFIKRYYSMRSLKKKIDVGTELLFLSGDYFFQWFLLKKNDRQEKCVT